MARGYDGTMITSLRKLDQFRRTLTGLRMEPRNREPAKNPESRKGSNHSFGPARTKDEPCYGLTPFPVHVLWILNLRVKVAERTATCGMHLST